VKPYLGLVHPGVRYAYRLDKQGLLSQNQVAWWGAPHAGPARSYVSKPTGALTTQMMQDGAGV